MKKNKYLIILFGLFLGFFNSCETSELDLTVSPNSLSPESADPNFVLNQIQLDLNRFFSLVSDDTARITRQINMFGAYATNITNSNLNTTATRNTWGRVYRINNNRLFLEGLITNNPDLEKHSGLADLMSAYTMTTLVDLVGDVPFTQANNPTEFPEPILDDGEDVYNKMIDLIDSGLAKLKSSSNYTVTQDLYYGGDLDKWIAFGNTLKLKMYNQIRKFDAARATTGINAVLASSDGLVDSASKDFQFQYSTTGSPVESRHRFFTNPYLGGGASVTLYMNNAYMNLLKLNDDPRLRSYFYRQSLTAPMGDDLPCTDPEPPYTCYINNYYWGRNHTNSDGVSADNLARTIYGIYPGGGAYDSNPMFVSPGEPTEFPGVSNTGLGGAGINPIILSSFTHFYLAESALVLGTSGDPRTYLQTGIEQSISKVLAFGTGANAPTDADITAFVDNVITQYDNAASQDEKLAVILTQFYIASFGNGIEPYNFYRKTGLPTLQTPVNMTAFPRSLILPTDETLTNSNIDTNFVTDQVFWDTNAAGFID